MECENLWFKNNPVSLNECNGQGEKAVEKKIFKDEKDSHLIAGLTLVLSAVVIVFSFIYLICNFGIFS